MNEIKTARINTGMTQKAVAAKIGIPLRSLQAYEAGDRHPPKWVERLLISEMLKIKEQNPEIE